MRTPLVVLFSILLTCAFLCACSQAPYQRVVTRGTYFSAAAPDRPYLKRALFVPEPELQTPFGRRIEDVYLQSLVDTIHTHADHLELSTYREQGAPASSAPWSIVAEKARTLGYHYVIRAGVRHVEPFKEKRGMLFFRKERGYVNLVLTIDVYDTFTGAKIVSRLVDDTVRVSNEDYENLVGGFQQDLAVVDEVAADYGEDLGGLAADTMTEAPWMALVVAVEARDVLLAAGRASGLKEGDRLVLYEGRRVVAGQAGENWVAPGYKLGDVRIVELGANRARARLDQPVDIKPGDIALPAP